MGYLYILSYTNLINDSRFKIGITDNPSIGDLLVRYRTYGDCIIISFISLGYLDPFYYESLIKRSLYDGRILHGTTLTEWVRIRYHALVLVIKAVINLGRPIKIHPDHYIIDEPENIQDPRFTTIFDFSNRNITEPINFADFEPEINNVYELLIPPNKLDSININELFPKNDVISMVGYFIDYARILNKDRPHFERLSTVTNWSKRHGGTIFTIPNIDNVILNSSENKCRFGCETCNKQEDPLTYCLEKNGCIACEGKRNAVKCFAKLEAKRELIAQLNANKQQRVQATAILPLQTPPNSATAKSSTTAILPLQTPLNNTTSQFSTASILPLQTIPNIASVQSSTTDIILNDHYYWIILKSSIDDGSEKYIISELIRNFKKMYPPCTSPKAHVYSIKHESNNSPSLYGLIRYNGLPSPYKMSASSAIFSHVIKQETTNIKQYREKKIKRLTIYISKKFQTNRQKILNKWNKITSSGEVVGNTLENFLS
ncbi:Hypothetical protein HVR_LOCUS497 [uncultured virus]|nr:Hypothetical protein HVR_LOCUS497 [uncultured virus]